ncbi:MAG: gliding motility protein GldN [Cytophagaceae bacterium]
MRAINNRWFKAGTALSILIIFISMPCLYAQRDADIMFKKTVIRALDLREKPNNGLFAKNNEITKWLVEGAVAGKIKMYRNDSLTHLQEISELKTKLIIPATGPVIDPNNPADTLDAYINFGADWRDNLVISQEYLPSDLYQMEIKENVIFDKSRSQLKYQVLALTIFIPADHPANIKGIQLPVASFSWEEVQKYFSIHPNMNYYNSYNEAAVMNLAEAIDLRRFSSYIIKVGNARDAYLTDIYNDPYKGIMASQWKQTELMEYEHNLWEF